MPRAAEWHELVFALDGSNGRRLGRIFPIQDDHLFSWSRPRSPEAIGVLKPLFSRGRRIAIPVMLYRLAQESQLPRLVRPKPLDWLARRAASGCAGAATPKRKLGAEQ
jgi:hypothetical protein